MPRTKEKTLAEKVDRTLEKKSDKKSDKKIKKKKGEIGISLPITKERKKVDVKDVASRALQQVFKLAARKYKTLGMMQKLKIRTSILAGGVYMPSEDITPEESLKLARKVLANPLVPKFTGVDEQLVKDILELIED